MLGVLLVSREHQAPVEPALPITCLGRHIATPHTDGHHRAQSPPPFAPSNYGGRGSALTRRLPSSRKRRFTVGQEAQGQDQAKMFEARSLLCAIKLPNWREEMLVIPPSTSHRQNMLLDDPFPLRRGERSALFIPSFHSFCLFVSIHLPLSFCRHILAYIQMFSNFIATNGVW